MDRVRRARVAAVLCIALATAASPVIAIAGAGGVPGPTRQDLDAAVAFRWKLGLRSDRAFVGSTFGDQAFSSAAWGVPLDRAESTEVQRRADVQKASGGAFRAWAAEAGSAGVYLDQRAGGIAVFLTTGDPARARRDVGALLPGGPGGANARFLRVRYSTEALIGVQDRVNADLRAGVLDRFGVTSTAIDTRANAVLVGVSAETDAVRAGLVARYGDAVRVAFEAPAQGGDAGCVSRTDCAPAKAGIEIRSSYNGNNCTIGFLVRVVGSPQPRLLTAGHCVVKSGGTGTSRKWRHDGADLGWAEFAWWTDGADADVGLVNPNTEAIGGDRNLAYRSSKDDVVPITGWQATAAQVQGGLVCRAGVTSGYHCGTIAWTNKTKEVDGQTIDHQWIVDFDACPGDSGGPYLLGNVAYGIHTDSSYGCEPSTNQAWYSPIGWALAVLAERGHPVELCTTASCGSATNVWTPRGSLGNPAWNPRLVNLDDGRVLAVGGLPRDPLAADAGGFGALAPQVFDPQTGLWTDTETPPWAPAECAGQFATPLPNGRVLVGGGQRVGPGDAAACADAHVFDPAASADAWETVAAPPTQLVSAGALLLEDGRAFITGGAGADGKTKVALAYSPATDLWDSLASPPAGAFSPVVLQLDDGRVLVSGGYVVAEPDGDGYTDVPATHFYNPAADSWSSTSPVGAHGMAGVVLRNGRVVLAGGQHLSWDGEQDVSWVATVSRFDPAAGTWSQLTPMPSARAEFTLVELSNGPLLAAGGLMPNASGGAASRTATAYDVNGQAWHPAPSLGTARAGQGSVVLDDGTVLVSGGATASTETYVAGDVLPPVGSAPSTTLRSGAQVSWSTVPIQVTWSAATDVGPSGVGTYDVGRSTDGGAFTTIATNITTRTFDTTVANGHVYRFQVRPRDWAGNVGAWKAGTTVKAAITDQNHSSIAYGGTWKTLSVGGYLGGNVRYAKSAGASATFTFTGRGFSIVSTRGPTLGGATVYIDGQYAGSMKLYSATWTYRYVAFQRTWSTKGTHKVKIVVVGNAGHPRVDVDAFIVYSNP